MITKQGDLATVVKMQKQERGLYDQVLEHVRKFLAHYVIKFVSDLQQVGGFLWYCPPIKLTTTI
jgi:hypothetical protein